MEYSGKEILNTQRGIFSGVGLYDIPEILPTKDVSIEGLEPVCINYHFSQKKKPNPEKSFLHFFIDDIKFERLWNNPDRYIESFKKYQYILAPDFSLYTDHPKAVQSDSSGSLYRKNHPAFRLV